MSSQRIARVSGRPVDCSTVLWIDSLLINNGYKDPRRIYQTRQLNPHPSSPRQTSHNTSDTNHVTCTLPFIDEQFSKQVTQFARSHNLPVKFIFTPGKTLSQMFCSSRPHDKPHCIITNCVICPLIISDHHDCKVKCIIYKYLFSCRFIYWKFFYKFNSFKDI